MHKILNNQSINKWVNQSINQSINQWVNQSINQSKAFFHRVTNTQEGVCWKVLTLSSVYTHFNTLNKRALWKHCGERWNFSKWEISPFPTMFSMQSVSYNSLKPHFNGHLQLLWIWDGLKMA